MTYPLVYLLIWAIPTSIRIYQAVTSNPAPFGIATVDKVENIVLLSSFLFIFSSTAIFACFLSSRSEHNYLP